MACVSCVREPMNDDVPSFGREGNSLLFSIVDADSETRAAESETAALKGGVIDLGETEDGLPLQFVDVVTRPTLPYEYARTKGTPATSENISTLYGSFQAVAHNGTKLVTLDGETQHDFSYREESGKWAHIFSCNPWKDNSELYFFMGMPEIPEGSSFTSNGTTHTISFSYTTPADAADQQDILFGGKATTKSEFESDPAAGFPVTFHHALAGVKFAIGNDANTTVITQVALKGIVNTGSFVITPGASSPVACTPGSTTTDYTISIPGVSAVETDVKNLNNDNLSLTLWLIPQTLSDDAELEVTYTINGGTTPHTLSAKINEALGDALVLAAGELHTFTLNPDEVNVTISDTCSETVLNDITITNTGNVAAYLRAVIVANWQDEYGNIVAAWDFEPTEFAGLPGTGWALGDDGYYYTTSTVAVGDEAPALFTSYTPPTTPPVPGSHLVMDVAVQAVKAKPISWAD